MNIYFGLAFCSMMNKTKKKKATKNLHTELKTKTLQHTNEINIYTKWKQLVNAKWQQL